jgi:hypothetical protein
VLFAANSTIAPPPNLPEPKATPLDQITSLSLSTSALPSGPTVAAAPASRAIAYGIDVAELNDRVAGYKVTLGGLKGRLFEKGDWNQARLAALVEELAELIARRGDLLLYVRLVSDDAAAAAALESPAAMVSLASGKISAARQRLESLAEKATSAAERLELARLSQLSRRLAILTADLQQQDR